eukprot:16446835-Heterocapsa_arctica.AAC.1
MTDPNMSVKDKEDMARAVGLDPESQKFDIAGFRKSLVLGNHTSRDSASFGESSRVHCLARNSRHRIDPA